MLSKKLAAIDKTRCVACGVCENTCPLGAVKVRRGCYAAVEAERCVGCGKCAKLCGIVWRLSQQPQFPSESARLANGKYHRPFVVVSKCALREKKRKAPGFSETFQRIQSCCGSFCIR